MNLEALQAVTGSAIQGVSGQIINVAAYKYEAEGKYGPSSFQPGKFRLTNGEEVAVLFKNQMQDMKALLNKSVTLSSKHGDKGLTGVKVEEFKGKPQLVVTATAIIAETRNGETGGAPAATAQPSTPKPLGAGTPPARPAPTKPAAPMNHDAAVIEAKKFVARNLSICIIALHATEKLATDYAEEYGHPMPDCLLVAAYNSLLFGSSQAGIIQGLPLNLDFATMKPVHKE